jgi:hypothetical protein
MTEDQYETERDAFRQAALQGMDRGFRYIAERHFRLASPAARQSATDQELPALFAALDVVFNASMARVGLTVSETDQ